MVHCRRGAAPRTERTQGACGVMRACRSALPTRRDGRASTRPAASARCWRRSRISWSARGLEVSLRARDGAGHRRHRLRRWTPTSWAAMRPGGGGGRRRHDARHRARAGPPRHCRWWASTRAGWASSPTSRMASTARRWPDDGRRLRRRAPHDARRRVWRDGERIFEGLSLNDVVVSRGACHGQHGRAAVDIGDDFVANLRADGLIVASPTGSHGLRAVGRRADPAPGHRRLGAGADRVAHAVQPAHRAARHRRDRIDHRGRARRQRPTSTCSAGQPAARRPGAVRRSAHKVRFLHPTGWSYYATLRRKLRWYEGVV
jgi:hypothetical protein